MFVRSRTLIKGVRCERRRPDVKCDADKAAGQSMRNRYSGFEELRPADRRASHSGYGLGDGSVKLPATFIRGQTPGIGYPDYHR